VHFLAADPRVDGDHAEADAVRTRRRRLRSSAAGQDEAERRGTADRRL
jgi:hypothetical protein